jgi:hypothetical protein
MASMQRSLQRSLRRASRARAGRRVARPAALLIIALLAMGQASPAHALSGGAVAPASDVVGSTTSHVVMLATEVDIEAGGSLRIGYPAGFTLASAALGPTSGLGAASVILAVQDSVAVLAITGAPLVAGALTIELLGVGNATRAGSATVTLESRDATGTTLEGPALCDPFTLVAGPAALFDLQPEGGGTVAGTPHVLVLAAVDAFGNRVAPYAGTAALATDTAGDGTNISWSAAGAGALVPTSPGAAAYTFAPGDSGQVQLTLSDTRAETLHITAQNGPLSGGATLDVQAAAPQSLLAAAGDGQTALVAATVSQAPAVRALDAFGNSVAARTVTFQPMGDGSADTDLGTPGDQTSALTDQGGLARCSRWTLATVAGSQTLLAVADFGDTVVFHATASPGPFAALALLPNGAVDVEAGSVTTVAARATDAFGNGVAGVEVTVLVTDPLDGALASAGETDSLGVAQQRGSTGGDGRVHVLYRAATQAGRTDRLDAVAPGLPASAVGDLVLTSRPGQAVAVRLQPPSGPVRAGEELGQLAITLVDAHGNVDTNALATLSVAAAPSSGIGLCASIAGPFVSPLAVSVGGSAQRWWRGGPAGTHTLTVTDPAAVLAGDSVSVTVIAGRQVASFTVSAPDTVVAGAPFPMTVVGFDAFGNFAADASTAFHLDAVLASDTTAVAPATLAVASGQLGAGSFTTNLQSVTRALTLRLRVSAAGRGYVGPPTVVLPGAAFELVSVGPDTLRGIVAGDVVAAEVEARDARGNAVAGIAVTAVLVEGGTLESPPGATGLDGRSSARLRTNSQVGMARLRLSILDGVPVARETRTLVVFTRSGAITALRLTPSSNTLTAGQTVPVQVEAVDVAGNRVDDATDVVVLGALGAGASIVPSSAALSSGLLSATLADTAAGSARVTAALLAAPAVTDTSAAIAVTAALAYRIVAVADTSVVIAAGAQSALLARVLDRYGNPVAGEPVRLELRSAPPGASLSDATPPPDDGIARTDAQGEAQATLALSAHAGVHEVRASILDRAPAALESLRWHVTGTAGAPATLELTTAPGALTAGVPRAVTLALLDAAGNLVSASGTVTMTFSPQGSATAPNPVTLSFGTASVDVTASRAGTLTIGASWDPAPAVGGALGPRAVLAGPPAGMIPVPGVDPPVNTADGLATTRLTAGPVTDTWGNLVAPGTPVTIASTLGALLFDDLDPLTPGLQRATDAAGQVEARLVAPISAGVATVTFVAGAAAGSAQAAFEERAALVFDGALAPMVVAPGETVSFTLRLRNAGQADALLSAAGTTFELDEGAGATYVAALAGGVLVPGGGTALLGFAAAPLDSAFAPGAHRPVVRLGGLDGHGQPIMGLVLLPDGLLAVSGLAVAAVSVAPVAAVVGDTVEVVARVRNVGGAPVQLTSVTIAAQPQGDFLPVGQDALPLLPPGGQIDHRTRLRVGAATLPGLYGFRAQVAGRSGTADFLAQDGLTALPLQVSTAARLAAVAGGVTPARVSRGATVVLRVQVRNDGGVPVSLDASRTRATVQTGAAAAAAAALAQPMALAAGGTTELVFAAATVDAAAPPGLFDLVLILGGDELGRAFADTLRWPAAIRVEAPAALALALPALSPNPVSLGASVRFTVRVVNSGEAAVDLDPLATTLRLGEPAAARLSAALDPLGPRALPPGETVLRFAPLDLPLDLTLGAPPAVVELRGTENMTVVALSLPLATGALLAQQPAALQIVASAPSQATVTAQQARPWLVKVALRNNGQAPLAVDPDPTRTRLDLLQGGAAAGGFVAQARAALDGGDLRLDAGETDTLRVDLLTTGPTAGPLVLLPQVEAVDLNSQQRMQDGSGDGGSGLVLVQAPAALAPLTLRAVPDTLSAGRVAPFSVRLAVRNGGGSTVRLRPLPPATALSARAGLGAWPLAATLTPATWAGSATLLLPAGGADSLMFVAQGPLPTAGTLTLSARVQVEEVNSGRLLADSLVAAVPLPQPPQVALNGLTGRAVGAQIAPEPGRIRVDAGGTATLVIRLANRGDGVADAVQLRVRSALGRVDSALIWPELTDTATVPLAIPAAPQPGAAEWLRVQLVAAVDRYGNRPAALEPSAERDSLLLLTVAPAALIAEQVIVRDGALSPIDRITAGQTSAFSIDLDVHNAGDAPLRIAAPQPQDVTFLLAGQPQADYLVTAPGGLLAGGGLLLDGQQRGVLRYSVLRAGSQPGGGLARVSAAAQDVLDGAGLAAQAETPLTVEQPAGLRILSTRTLHPRAPQPQVDAGQIIRARVAVGNSGQEAVDSLTVVVAGTMSPPSSAAPAVLSRLAAGAVDSLDFQVAVTSALGAETLVARVTRARSANTGLPVPELAPLDNVQALEVQRPVRLAFSVTLPGSADPLHAAVTPGQLVALRVALDHVPPLDGQGDWLPVEVTFPALSPFTLEPPLAAPLLLSPVQSAVVLQLRAPTQASLTTLVALLAGDRLDRNDPARVALTTQTSASVQLDVQGGQGIDACALAVVAPPGAADLRLSAGQSFTVRGSASAPPNLQQRALRLLLPPALSLPGGDPLRALAAGVDTASWRVQAPATPASQLQIRLVASATDVQSGQAVAETCATLAVAVEQAARAEAAGALAAPASARDFGQVYPGAQVTVKGWIQAAGSATLAGPSALRLTPPPQYPFTGGSVAIVTLATAADTALWTLQAPAVAGAGVDQLVLQLATVPLDANSGLPAGDAARAVRLPLATVSSLVRLAAGDAVGEGPIVAGSALRDRMELGFSNGSSAAVQWTSLSVWMVDAGGSLLPDPAGTLAELAVTDDVSGARWSSAVAGNPASIALTATLAPGQARGFHLAARAAEGGSFVPFALRVQSAAGIAAQAPDGTAVAVQLTDLHGAPRTDVTSALSVRSPAALAASAHSYPNPFVPSREAAVIAYSLAAGGSVEISIFDLLGNPVRQWSFAAGEPQAAAGLHDGDVHWDGLNGRGQDVRSGLYVCRIRAGGQQSFFRIAVTR